MKKFINAWQLKASLIWVALLLVGISCREDDPAPNITNEENTRINSWILENMEFWYLWNDQLPASPDKNLDPDDFFKTLLSDEDRFSWIQDNYQELLNALQGITKEAGFEYVLYRESESSNNVQAQLLYIKPDSPAEQAGLRRGDVITHINNEQITTSNYQTLVRALRENHTLRYKPIVTADGTFEAEQTVSMTVVEYSENPHFLSTVIEVQDRKIGYYVYNFFANGTDADPQAYDQEMADIFASFQAAGITDLVLDLRFNSGGAESAAKSLASFVGKGVDNTKVFARREYNPLVEEAIIDELGADYLVSKFDNKTSNVGNSLRDGRVYVLTSSRTASASELIINALNPFMDVFLIGDVTYGKNVGSISLYEENDPDNTWGLQPIVVKVYNSQDQSDYGNGFSPDVSDKDNALWLRPLGDPQEALLARAIAQITGTAQTGRAAPGKDLKEIIGHSLDEKRRSYNLIIDAPVPKGLLQ